MGILSNCKPASVFKYFEEICAIPHGSWNEKALSDHIHAWAKDLGLESQQDSINNLIIRKPATPGYEAAPTAILQGHLDMVCEKNSDIEFDFATQPLDIYIDGDYIKARGTTLGADNGIAVAMAMAVLADNSLQHPALEVVFTAVEEAGMDGAKAIDGTKLKGKYLINIDSEHEGTFLASCAGGARIMAHLNINWQDVDEGMCVLKIFIGGLKGGHSGMDINKNRGNSNNILGRLLDNLTTECNIDYKIADIGGGSKDNAIPREAWATIVVAENDKAVTKEQIEKFAAILSNELQHSDAGIFVKTENAEMPGKVFNASTTKAAVQLLFTIPSGVAAQSPTLDYLVETSNNLGVVRIENNEIIFTSAVRSSVESQKEAHIRKIVTIAEAMGAKCHITDGYPGWAYNPNSAIRDIFQRVYKEKYGKDSQILAIHAGVECGIFSEKIPGLDIISFGPNMHDVHTPDERLSISSVANCYGFLTAVLLEVRA